MATNRSKSKATRGASVRDRTDPKSAVKAAKKSGRPRHGPHMKRKNFYVDQAKLDRVRASLGAVSETEAIDQALGRIDFVTRFMAGLAELRAAGGLEYFDERDRPPR